MHLAQLSCVRLCEKLTTRENRYIPVAYHGGVDLLILLVAVQALFDIPQDSLQGSDTQHKRD